MAYKYQAIKLKPDSSYYIDEDGQPLESIDSLSSINVIVGSNNAGKSRFLRELIKIEDFKYRIKELDLGYLQQELVELNKELNTLGATYSNIVTFRVSDAGERNYTETAPGNFSFGLDTYIDHNFFTDKPVQKIRAALLNFRDGHYSVASYSGPNDIRSYERDMKVILNKYNNIIDLLSKRVPEEINFKKFYIPTLRSLNYFGLSSDHKNVDFFKIRVCKNYSLDEEKMKLDIFTGQSLYTTVRSMLLGDIDQRKRIEKYQNFLSEKLFNGQEVYLIPKEKDDVLHIKIGEDERAVYDLGDGIQSLIMLTFPLFEVEYGIFFIEEPEIHLHPALQRKLTEVLKEMKNHQYFITTHSNHFLDLTLDYSDTSIYTFKKESKHTVVKLVSQADENILQLLGARNSSVFLSNSTIWVEGITDRLYIRKYLELYQSERDEKIVEDVDYSFVEYGGDNITHWSFLHKEESPINVDRLCAKSILITDKDGDKKMDRKTELQATLGDRYVLLNCNEIENSLSLKVIEKVLRKYEKANKFVVPKMKLDAHINSKIGVFIEENIFDKQTIKRKGGYRDSSGTIKGKVDFCKKAVEELSLDEMSSTALGLAETLYKFVILHKNDR